MSAYTKESAALDAGLQNIMRSWHAHGRALREDDFNDLALRIFSYQLAYNEPYRRYCASVSVTSETLPQDWRNIPAVPASAFKDAVIATFDPARAELIFETSGTTRGRPGVHYMETAALYDEALLAGFERAMLADGAVLRYFNLVPNPLEHPRSSLGYMMERVSTRYGDGKAGWYVHGGQILVSEFIGDLELAVKQAAAACIAGTAFALSHLLDALRSSQVRFALPAGSRIMETGGFKGRARALSREELYDRLAATFGIAPQRIVAEYGMTELTSQYYDAHATRKSAQRIKAGPPWLRTMVVDAAERRVPHGTVGALVHFDLANRASAVAIATEDLGYATGEGFVLLGRDAHASLRGCSLDAEDLLPT